MNTHESYVSLETAKLLKEVGFDWECFFYYENKKLRGNYGTYPKNMNASNIWQSERYCSAPSLSVVQRWLREEKLYDVLVDTGGYQNYEYFINYHGVKEGPNYPFHEYNHDLICSTYEKALEAGIQNCLIMLWEEMLDAK